MPGIGICCDIVIITLLLLLFIIIIIIIIVIIIIIAINVIKLDFLSARFVHLGAPQLTILFFLTQVRA